MIEAFVLHKSLSGQDNKWHSIGTMSDPEVWAQRAADEYGRPVGLKREGKEMKVFEPRGRVE